MNAPHQRAYVWQHSSWPAWEYDSEVISASLTQARLQQGKVLGKAQVIDMSGDALTQVVNDIWVQEVLATAAIEGHKLDFDQVRSSVMRKLGMATAGPSPRHVDGLVDVMHDAIQNFSVPLDFDRLFRWQSALFPGGTSGIQRIEVGKFRTCQDPMQIVSGRPGKEVVHYRAPDSRQVPQEMAQFLAWFNKPSEIEGIVRAAITHLWFETIHPFEDGNGRVGRAIMDMAIAQDAQSAVRLYSMSRQLQENRTAYYDALKAAQTGNLDITPWIDWFAKQFALACIKSERIIDQALEKAAYWAKHVTHSFNARQRKALQKLLDAGDGGFLGGLTAEKYCKITGVSKATATRDLSHLLQQEALVVRGVGKATKYYINVSGWHQKGSDEGAIV
ncbi:Fic family protein [Glaciimonas immobilis]|uniref:Fic family protein n=1 Tax=Glaciimonas immobilis TaxID=728004 RepID=A0A840RYW3_9BURK|nr:Fic family protein [Glaciimonas immobilis]KAF3998686.1 Fic family protein [Glaciimonas immobilis]MBB5201559.1 Fic family protein [Glaciimonas immobilis]